MNKVIIIGRLGKDPELKQSSGGKSYCILSIADNTGRKDANGKEIVTWLNVFVWDKTATNASNYLNKASQVYIEARLSNTDKGLLLTAVDVIYLDPPKKKPLDQAIDNIKIELPSRSKVQEPDIFNNPFINTDPIPF